VRTSSFFELAHLSEQGTGISFGFVGPTLTHGVRHPHFSQMDDPSPSSLLEGIEALVVSHLLVLPLAPCLPLCVPSDTSHACLRHVDTHADTSNSSTMRHRWTRIFPSVAVGIAAISEAVNSATSTR